MRVCVLQPSYRDSRTSPIRELDSQRDLTALLAGHEVEHLFLDKATVVPQLSHARADVFVNLCDGAWDEDTPGLDVVQTLERRRVAFTGAGSSFYDPSRAVMKQLCYYQGVATPAFVFADSAAGIEEALARLRFPLFVKPRHGSNSVGIDERSRVTTASQLREQAARVIEQFGGALIEEFIEGRELSVLVASDPRDEESPRSFRPVECVFGEGPTFKTFDAKWKGARNPWRSCTDDALAESLTRMTREMFVGLGGSGYARADIRVDREGRLWFLELNPNCSIFYPDDNGATADVILALDGCGKARFAEQIIEFALHRRQLASLPYVIRFDPLSGYGMHAARDIAAGERIVVYEEQPHVLVSRQRVEALWGARKKEWFKHFAYPLTDELWVMWDSDPERWKPINHSCDPNSWVTGLDLCARRAIARGEAITMDYATMYTKRDVDFRCECGSALCRGAWEGEDHLKPWFQERYGEHVTDYVKGKQRQK